MRRIAWAAALLASGLLTIGCGQKQADQPSNVPPPPAATGVAPAEQPSPAEPAQTATPEEPAAPPAVPEPAVEGPAFPEPPAETPAAAEPAGQQSQSARPAGQPKILGAIGNSLLKAVTGQSGQQPPRRDDAPAYQSP